jgi:hypothetical protein
LPRIKRPFLHQPAIHFATTLIELVSSYYIKASRTFKNSSFKDYKILKDNKIFSFIWITSANTNGKSQRGKENIIPDSSRNYNIEIKKWNEDITEELERNLHTQFQLQKKKVGRC